MGFADISHAGKHHFGFVLAERGKQRADLSVHIAFGIIVAVDKDKIIDVKPRQLLGNVAAESSAAYDQYSAAESLHYPPDAGDKNITLSPSFNFVLYIFSDAIFTSLT